MNEKLIYKIIKIEQETIPMLNFYLEFAEDNETEQISMEELDESTSKE